MLLRNPIISQILQGRGIKAAEEEAFLRPDFARDLEDGGRFKDMPQAVARMKQAIQEKERVAVFGDYDADGVPGTAILVRGLSRLGIEVMPFIPTREAGYGLTMDTVAMMVNQRVQLLITVDNGTVAKTEIEALAKAGIDTIVCDHHEPQEGHIAEAALAILNPKQADCPYPFKELCGAAIAWKLLWELYQFLGEKPDFLKWELDLVALATIADMVPLRGENRLLALYGLQVLHKTRNLGLRALANQAGLSLQSVTSGAIGFQLAPRLNAPSRLHQETREGKNAALHLLITEDEGEAQQLAAYVSDCNDRRKEVLESALAEARVQADEQTDKLCVVVYGETWSAGVIGLVAGRILEQVHRPVVALAPEGAVMKGSVRSVDGVPAVAMLTAAEACLEKFGGHSKAAGLTLKPGVDVAHFAQTLHQYIQASGQTKESLFAGCLRQPDLMLSLGDITLDLADQLAGLEPFGVGFPRPLFRTSCRLTNLRRVGQNRQHLACVLEDATGRQKAIAFQMGSVSLEEDREYDIHYTLQVEEWNGRRQLSCHISHIDMKHA